jgi:hypothetical protein
LDGSAAAKLDSMKVAAIAAIVCRIWFPFPQDDDTGRYEEITCFLEAGSVFVLRFAKAQRL